jgi:hypothetical protein
METNWGLNPTHMQELRKKQAFRLFFEELAIDFKDVLVSFLMPLSHLYDFVVSGPKKFVTNNKRYAIMMLIAAIIVAVALL